MGGQAGVIANQMAALGANSLVYTSLLSPKQGSMFFPSVKVPVVDETLRILNVQDAVRPTDNTKVNWIFEYPKNMEFNFNGEVVKTPRANRVIMATRPDGVVMAFSDEIAPYLPELGQQIDVAFMAGYHYAPSDEEELNAYLSESMASLKSLKQKNPKLRLHLSIVPMSDEAAERTVLKTVAQEIQSFGINENEIKRVLVSYGYQAECDAIQANERAYCLYHGVRRLAETLNFERIQLHNLGYYVVFLKKPHIVDPEIVRDACLYASSVNAIKAKYGGYVEKTSFMKQLRSSFLISAQNRFAALPKKCAHKAAVSLTTLNRPELLIWVITMYLVVPAHVVPNPVSTVGMGDTISSSAYAYECKVHAAGRIVGA